MSNTTVQYVVLTPEGGWRIVGTRVSLDSVVHAYREGLTPEAIRGEFPSLSLEQVHGALAFYFHHKAEIDHYLQDQELKWKKVQDDSESQNKDLLDRLRDQRQPLSKAP